MHFFLYMHSEKNCYLCKNLADLLKKTSKSCTGLHSLGFEQYKKKEFQQLRSRRNTFLYQAHFAMYKGNSTITKDTTPSFNTHWHSLKRYIRMSWTFSGLQVSDPDRRWLNTFRHRSISIHIPHETVVTTSIKSTLSFFRVIGILAHTLYIQTPCFTVHKVPLLFSIQAHYRCITELKKPCFARLFDSI